MDIPSFLQPNSSASAPTSIDQAVQVNPDWSLPDTTMVQPAQSFWEQVADVPSNTASAVSETAGSVWSTAKGAWVSAETSVVNAVDSAGNSLGGFVSVLEGHLFLILAVLVAAIYFIGKSGIVGQAAPLAMGL